MKPIENFENGDVLRALWNRDAEELTRQMAHPEAIVYDRFYRPLHTAASEGFTRGCEVIVDAGCPIDVTDKGWRTPLSDGVEHTEIVRWFLAHGAMVDGHETCVSTPLLNAARGGHLNAMRMLLDAGADLEREGASPGNAFDLAYAWGHTGTTRDGRGGEHADVVDLLAARGAFHAYVGKHDWSAFPCARWLEHLEQHLGPLNARAKRVGLGEREVLLVRSRPKTWAAPPNVFVTAGLDPRCELGVILPPSWPLNREALRQHRFAWPLELLLKLGQHVQAGAPLRPREVIEPTDARISGLDVPRFAWHVWEAITADKRQGTPGLFLLVPEELPAGNKRRRAPALPDSLVKPKWERLQVPFGDLTPSRLLPSPAKPAERYLYPDLPPVPTAIEYVPVKLQQIPKDGPKKKQKKPAGTARPKAAKKPTGRSS